MLGLRACAWLRPHDRAGPEDREEQDSVLLQIGYGEQGDRQGTRNVAQGDPGQQQHHQPDSALGRIADCILTALTATLIPRLDHVYQDATNAGRRGDGRVDDAGY